MTNWLTMSEITAPGFYLCRIKDDDLFNSWTTVIGEDEGVFYINDSDGSSGQKLIHKFNEKTIFYGPIPE